MAFLTLSERRFGALVAHLPVQPIHFILAHSGCAVGPNCCGTGGDAKRQSVAFGRAARKSQNQAGQESVAVSDGVAPKLSRTKRSP